MEKDNLAGVLLSRHENVSWATAGQVEHARRHSRRDGSAAVFVRKDGKAFYLRRRMKRRECTMRSFGELPPLNRSACGLRHGPKADFAKAAHGLRCGRSIGADTHEAEL